MRILVLCTFVLILLFDITPEISAKICIYETRYGLQKICQNDYECWSHCMNDKRGTGDCDDHRRCICQRRFPRKSKNPRNENDLNKWFIED